MLRKDQFTICDLSPRPEIKYVSSQHDEIDFILRCSILTLAEKICHRNSSSTQEIVCCFCFFRFLLGIVLTVVDCENFYNGPVAL